MKSSWIGIGFSDHSVPSLSNTARRSSTGTGGDPSRPQTRSTNATIARRVGVSRQVESSAAACSGAFWVDVMTALLLARHHRDGLALEVDVGLAADVDGDARDRAAGEPPRRCAGVVLGDGVGAVAPDAESVAGERELARLGLDPSLADLDVAVEERERPDRHARRVLALLLEARGQDQLLARRKLGVGDDLLLDAADEAVDVVQPVLLDVERVAAEA